MTTLLTATRNAHKVQEISQILGDGFRFLTLRDFPEAPVPVEDADTFAGNAAKKVLSLAEWLTAHPELIFKRGLAENSFHILADDSGLEVDALGGAPGVHSARFAAEDSSTTGNAPDSANNAKLLRLLEGIPAQSRTARFCCVLASLPLVFSPETQTLSSKEIVVFDGVCEGSISTGGAGAGGFGYDPLFVPAGHTQSFAELGEETKNKLSHRARALEKLKQYFGRKPA